MGNMKRRTVLLGLVAILAVGLSFQILRYMAYVTNIRPGLRVGGIQLGGIQLGGMSADEAARRLESELALALARPIQLRYVDEPTPLLPEEVGFRLDSIATAQEALRLSQTQQPFWAGFLDFILGGPQRIELEVPLRGSFDEQPLRARLARVAAEHDQPMSPVEIQLDTLTLYPGQEERRLDLEASLPVVEGALLSVDERVADLVVERRPPSPPELSVLRDLLEHRTDQFVGLVGLYLTDLESGQRLEINSDTVYSGMSVVKVGIMAATLIHLNGREPDEDVRNYMLKIAIDPVGSNYWANLLLDEIGDDSQTLGAQRTTEIMRALGLTHTFIRAPYRIETGSRPLGLARVVEIDRTRADTQFANPDPFIQTSPHDIGTLLEMIYYCAQGRGPLMEIYPGQITPSGCQLILDVLKENPVRPWLGSGIPAEISLAHKHGFAYDTIGDAGIIYSSGGDYVLSVFVYANTDWLGCGAQPVFFDISRLVYAFFNLESGLWSPPFPECR